MQRSVLRRVRAVLVFGLLLSCGNDLDAEPAEPGRPAWASPRSGGPGQNRHPPHWTRWTTDGQAAIENGDRFLTHGLRCRGDYCDDIGLLSGESGYRQIHSWWTDHFSEEGQNYRVCEGSGFVTGLHCTGRYCDNLALRCSELDNGGVRDGCYWTATVSDDDGGSFVLPGSMYVAGVSCNGRYCDNLNLYVCQAEPFVSTTDPAGLAAKFAPRLRFDQETTTGSGASSKCFPGDPGSYFAARAAGVDPISLCNKDYASIAKGTIPTYYVASRVGSNAFIIRYWYFYAWQSTCFGPWGEHAADWESMAVLIVDGELRRVAFSQHGGWYSREPGGYELAGSHPVGYVGKNAHGTYHDGGGSGGCLYFEDYRNPGGNDYHMDTWQNLQPLARGEGRPAWMNCQGSGCFDGIGHPLEQTGDVRSMGGCGKDGCGRSSVGGHMPFINDPTGAEYTTISVQHSGRAIDVPGASTANGVGLTQYANWHVDNQRWLLEATGDDTFTLRARHSGKCMDVTGASQAGGASLVQWSCNGGSNQRFRLLSGGNGYYAMQTRHSSQCLDIAGWAQDDGGALIQWPCAWTANQSFTFAP